MSPWIEAVNDAAHFWSAYVWHAGCHAGLLAMLVLIALRWGRRLPPSWRYGLLLVVLVKFVVPPMAATEFGVYFWAAPPVPIPSKDAALTRAERNAILPMEMRDTTEYETSPFGQTTMIDPASGMPQRPLETLSRSRDGRQGHRSGESSLNNRPGPRGTTQTVDPPAPKPDVRDQSWTTEWVIAWQSRHELSLASMLMIAHGLSVIVLLIVFIFGLLQFFAMLRKATRVFVWGSDAANPITRLAPSSGRAISYGELANRFVDLSKKLDVHEDVDLFVSEKVARPLSVWFFQSKIILPAQLLDRLNHDQLDAVIAHMLIHHRRLDGAANLGQLLILMAWWFHPLLWLVDRQMRLTKEECCDDAVLHDLFIKPEDYHAAMRIATEKKTDAPEDGWLGFEEPPCDDPHRVARMVDATLGKASQIPAVAMIMLIAIAIFVLPGARTIGVDPDNVDASIPLDQFNERIVRVRGRVVDELGEPIANVVVWLGSRWQTVRTDGEGFFEFTSTPNRHKINFVAPGYLEIPISGDVYFSGASNTDVPRVFVLAPSARTEIQVISDSGLPIPGARITRVTSAALAEDSRIDLGYIGRSPTQTDELGQWMDDLKPAVEPILYRFDHPSYHTDYALVFANQAGKTYRARVVLPAGEPVEGWLEYTDGNIASDVTVIAKPARDAHATFEQSSTSDEQGQIVWRKIVPDDYEFWMVLPAPSSEFTSRLSDLTRAPLARRTLEAPHQPLLLTVPELQTITPTIHGRINSRLNIPLRIVVESDAGKWMQQIAVDQNSFSLDVPQGLYNIRVYAGDRLLDRVENIYSPSDEILLDIGESKASDSIAVRVEDAATGVILEKVSATIHTNNSKYALSYDGLQMLLGDPDISFRAAITPDPAQVLVVGSTGYRSWRMPTTEFVDRDDRHMVIKLKRASRLTGLVVDPQSQPINDAMVVAIPDATDPANAAFYWLNIANRERLFLYHALRTGYTVDGMFDITNLDTRKFTLRTYHPGFQPGQSTAIYLGETSMQLTQPLVLDPAPTIIGQVFDEQGQPRRGARLLLTQPRGDHARQLDRLYNRWEYPVQADDQGRFEVAAAPVHGVDVQLLNEGAAGVIRRVLDVPAGIESFELNLGGDDRSLAGRLLLNNQPLALTALRACNLDIAPTGFEARTQSDVDGSFAFAGLPAERFMLERYDSLHQTWHRVREVDATQIQSISLGDVHVNQHILTCEVVHGSLTSAATRAHLIEPGLGEKAEISVIAEAGRFGVSEPFVFHAIHPGAYLLRVTQSDGLEIIQPTVMTDHVDGHHVTFTLEPRTAHLSGRYSGDDQALRILRSDGRYSAAVNVVDGYFQFPMLPPGQYQFVDPKTYLPRDESQRAVQLDEHVGQFIEM